VSELISTFTLVMMTKSQKMDLRFGDLRRQLLLDMDTLERMIADEGDKQQSANFAILKGKLNDLVATLDSWRKLVSTPDALAGMSAAVHVPTIRRDAIDRISKVLEASAVITDYENKRGQSYLLGEKGARQRVVGWLTVFVIGNVLLCIALANFFAETSPADC
jgi:hypothetical protein